MEKYRPNYKEVWRLCYRKARIHCRTESGQDDWYLGQIVLSGSLLLAGFSPAIAKKAGNLIF